VRKIPTLCINVPATISGSPSNLMISFISPMVSSSGLMFLITIAGWMFGISAGAETLQLLAVAFVVFIIPHIAEWLIIRIAVINYGLRDFIKS